MAVNEKGRQLLWVGRGGSSLWIRGEHSQRLGHLGASRVDKILLGKGKEKAKARGQEGGE